MKELNIAIITVSDSRDDKTDKSGNLLKKLISDANHMIKDKVGEAQ